MALASLQACNKKIFDDDITATVQSDLSNQAQVKVVYASVNNQRDSVQIKLNSTRVGGKFLSPTTTNLPTPQPGGGLNTGGSNFPDYFIIAPGSTTIGVAVPKLKSVEDSIVRFSGTATFEAKQRYTAFITDTAANAKLVVIKEDGVEPAPNKSIFKFVNLIPNRPAMDLYFGPLPVALNIAYGASSPSFEFPAGLTAQWALRPTGTSSTSTPVAVYPAATQIVPAGRVFTVFSKGYVGVTGIRLPTISLLYNK